MRLNTNLDCAGKHPSRTVACRERHAGATNVMVQILFAVQHHLRPTGSRNQVGPRQKAVSGVSGPSVRLVTLIPIPPALLQVIYSTYPLLWALSELTDSVSIQSPHQHSGDTLRPAETLTAPGQRA